MRYFKSEHILRKEGTGLRPEALRNLEVREMQTINREREGMDSEGEGKLTEDEAPEAKWGEKGLRK